LFYLFVYTLATFGAFAVVVTLTREGQESVMLDELAGLWTVRPWLALAMAVIMFSLLGFPIFGGAGFFAKWYVLQAILQSPAKQTTLAVVLVITTVVSAGYYLYVVMLMFMRPRADDAPTIARSGGLTRVVLAASVAVLLVLGVIPEAAIQTANKGQPKMELEPSITELPIRQSAAPIDTVHRVAQTRAALRTR